MNDPVSVRCKVIAEGMFSDETVVEIEVRGGNRVCFTVARSELGSDGTLRGILLDGGRVQLPTSFRDTVAVAETSVERTTP